MVVLAKFEFETLEAEWQEEDADDVDKNPFIKKKEILQLVWKKLKKMR